MSSWVSITRSSTLMRRELDLLRLPKRVEEKTSATKIVLMVAFSTVNNVHVQYSIYVNSTSTLGVSLLYMCISGV